MDRLNIFPLGLPDGASPPDSEMLKQLQEEIARNRFDDSLLENLDNTSIANKTLMRYTECEDDQFAFSDDASMLNLKPLGSQQSIQKLLRKKSLTRSVQGNVSHTQKFKPLHFEKLKDEVEIQPNAFTASAFNQIETIYTPNFFTDNSNNTSGLPASFKPKKRASQSVLEQYRLNPVMIGERENRTRGEMIMQCEDSFDVRTSSLTFESQQAIVMQDDSREVSEVQHF